MIRDLRAGDREALAVILRGDEAFRADEVAVALELIDGALAGDPDYVVLVAIADEQIAGYVLYGPTAMTRATFDLYWIVVERRARGRGLARALVGAMEAAIRARGGRNIRVETSPSDAHVAARKLYERLGYPIAVELPDFYAPGEALLTYYKQL
ncbi:MAG: putative acetyltransferase [Myxococcales bacterium]|nr:putative acetyltransferase [Myxococcales bacterium]